MMPRPGTAKKLDERGERRRFGGRRLERLPGVLQRATLAIKRLVGATDRQNLVRGEAADAAVPRY
jgi:hypothetical protein